MQNLPFRLKKDKPSCSRATAHGPTLHKTCIETLEPKRCLSNLIFGPPSLEQVTALQESAMVSSLQIDGRQIAFTSISDAIVASNNFKDKIMNKTTMIFSILLLCGVAIGFVGSPLAYSAEPTSSPYLERVKEFADTMEVFPVDFIACYGPLACYPEKPLSGIGTSFLKPSIGIRLDLDRRNFSYFYKFCQLAFDATPADIDACVEFLAQASPKEKALILTILFVYVYPWEEQPEIAEIGGPLHKHKRRSYVSFLYPCGVFDLTQRENRRSKSADSDTLLKTIDEYLGSEEVAFPKVDVDFKNGNVLANLANKRNTVLSSPSTIRRVTKDFLENAEEVEAFLRVLGKNMTRWDAVHWMDVRKDLMTEIRNKTADPSESISNYLYAFYAIDLVYVYEPFEPASGTGGFIPRSDNASAEPKTLGQIAQQLLDSWENRPHAPEEETSAE